MPDHTAVPNPAPPSTPRVSWGLTSTLGVLLTLLPLVSGLVVAVEGSDAAGAGIAGGGILAGLVTLGGRYAQAVALVRSTATSVGPWLDALQEAISATPPGDTARIANMAAARALDAWTPPPDQDTRYVPTPEDLARQYGDADTPEDRPARVVGGAQVQEAEPGDLIPPDLADDDLELVDGDVTATSSAEPIRESESMPDPDVLPGEDGSPRPEGDLAVEDER